MKNLYSKRGFWTAAPFLGEELISLSKLAERRYNIEELNAVLAEYGIRPEPS
jgi:hypothetical protein